MELLERYLRQVKKHLPIKDKEDTIEELRSLILEELDSRTNGINDEKTLNDIITGYGYPIEVAAKYRNTDPLISNTLRPYLYFSLKVISMVVPFGIILATIVGYIDDYPFNFLELLLSIAYSIPSIINGLISAWGIVFIVFILIERYAKLEFEEEIPPFNPKNLPHIPKSVFKISIFEQIFAVLMTVLFLYLLNYQPGLISIYLDGVKYPLLNENFENLLPFINFSLFFALGVSIAYLIQQRKTYFTSTLDLVQTLYSAVILIVLASSDIFNEIIIDGHNLNVVPNITTIAMYIGATATIIGGLFIYIKIVLADKKIVKEV